MRIGPVVLSLLLLNPVRLEAAPALQHSWSKIFGDVNTQDGRGIAVDPSGNVWITGMFRGTVNFGGGDFTVGSTDDAPYLAKFNAGGTHLYSVGFFQSTTASEYGTALACDPFGNVALAGQVSGSVNLGGSTLSTAGGTDIFVGKFNSAGVHQWSKIFGDALNQIPNDIATDGSGNIYMTGFVDGTVDFGGGPLTGGGGADIFLVKFDPAGNHLWSKRFGATGSQNGIGVEVSADGDVGIAGNMAGSADFGGGTITSGGSNDIFAARFTSAGVHVWSKRFGDSSSQIGNGIGFDPAGNVFVTGTFQGTVDFGGGGLTSAGGNDVCIAKLDAAGNHVWSKHFGDAGAQNANGPAVDAGGAVAWSGYFAGSVDFGTGALTSAGGTDVFLVRFDNDGNLLFNAMYGDASDQRAARVVTDPANNVVMTGYVNGTTNFGGNNLTASGQDIFIVRFSRQNPEIHNIVDVPGDQGGWVRVYFQGSGEDIAGASPAVLTYYVFRRIDNAALVAQIQSEGVVKKSSAIEWEGRRFWREPSLDAVPTAALWESVASAPARQQSSDYIVLAPTQADQTVSVTPYNVYFVMAQTTTPSVYYDSAPDSGYSVDNLAPAAPQNLAGAQSYSPAGLSMSWQPNDEHDLANYGVYRGSTAGFVPDAGNRIATPASESFLDPAWTPPSGYYYKVSAFDLHDNESAFALLTPDAVTSAGTTAARTHLDQNVPNPFNPTTRISYGVERDGPVSLRIYDARGALVRSLLDTHRRAGTYVAEWDGVDNEGRPVGSGIYFYRLNAGGATLARKMLLLK